ncbi:ribonuclease activity regulator RraA [Paracandidimonas lactea]|uniref:ribonuclease activity regulator RraA n=1 Tax=Paracandidimonas lactea TaxID=2895524 RepID=UPI001F3995E0|nr:ribonuclease activity regulator RraA [Paracandidimonas lactea]
MTLDNRALEILQEVTTATITTVLLKKGLRHTWLRGAQPLAQGLSRVVGPAFTLRFIPAREDLATPESWRSPTSTRAAIEAMPEGVVAVIDAFGTTDAGVWGDILCERMVRRKVAGMVTDGVVRDAAGVIASGLPVWSRGQAAPPSVAGLTFAGWQEPIGCGGVAVYPGDIIVADQDGVVSIPAAYLDDVLALAPEQERLEAWTIEQVRAGHALPGLYPANEENLARYEAFKRGAQG